MKVALSICFVFKHVHDTATKCPHGDNTVSKVKPVIPKEFEFIKCEIKP
jgi:hypothetical protein